MTQLKINRRDFLKFIGIGTAVVASTQIVKGTDASEGVQGEHQWAMVIDQYKCTGCGY